MKGKFVVGIAGIANLPKNIYFLSDHGIAKCFIINMNEAEDVSSGQQVSADIVADWTAWFRFPPRERDFSLLHSAHIDCEAHPASYRMGTTGLKRPGRAADHTVHRVPRPRTVDLYLLSPKRLHGVLLNFNFSCYFYLLPPSSG